MPKFIFTCILLLSTQTAIRSQVIISLIFGEALNSPNIEFGLDGGLTMSNLSGLNSGERLQTFNLGFYFDFKFSKHPQWMINIGEMVVANMGSSRLPVYSLNNIQLDSVLAGGTVTRKLSYFNTLVFLKYMFKNNIYVKAGVQADLMSKAYDEFSKSVREDEDLLYMNNIKNQYKSIDFGLSAGFGYRLLKGDGINLGMQFYFGLTSILKDENAPKIYNRCLYINAGIPVGAAKSTKKRENQQSNSDQ